MTRSIFFTPRPQVNLPVQKTCSHLYTRFERVAERVKCFAQEHNTISPARSLLNSPSKFPFTLERVDKDHLSGMCHFELQLNFINLFAYSYFTFIKSLSFVYLFCRISKTKMCSCANQDTM